MDVLSDLTGRKENNMLEEKLNEWVQKVLNAYSNSETYIFVDTYKMMVDVDKIIAEGFGHRPVFVENL